MWLARKAALRLKSLAQIELHDLDRVDGVDSIFHQSSNGVVLWVEQWGSGQERAMLGIDKRLNRVDIAQGLVGRIVVEPVELRKDKKGITRVCDEVICTEDN